MLVLVSSLLISNNWVLHSYFQSDFLTTLDIISRPIGPASCGVNLSLIRNLHYISMCNEIVLTTPTRNN